MTISGTEGLDGTLTWTLFGPVAAGPSGTCSTATWPGAPVFDNGTVAVGGDGVVLTTPSTPTVDGCYSYADVLSSPYYTTNATSAVGQPAETFAWPVTPTMTTAINADGYSDDITIRGTRGFGGTVAWTLLGPVNAGPGGTCSEADYSSAPTNASATRDVVGDVTVTVTPPADPTAPGCYTYEVTLTGPNIAAPVTSRRGEPAESFARASTPSIATEINPDGFSDDISVTATSGFAGSVAWTLLGPVDAGASGTCVDAAWAGAPVFDSGTLPIAGDGTSTATPATPSIDGCYSYAAVLSGANYTADAISAVGVPSETFSVPLAPSAPPTTSTTTTTTPMTDPCAHTTTTTSSTTTTTSSAPESSVPDSSVEPLAAESSTTSTSTSTPGAAPPSSGPVGFSRSRAQVPEPCAPPTTLASRVPPPAIAAATPPGGGAAAAAEGSSTGALPRTGHGPAAPLVIVAIAMIIAGSALVGASRQRD